MSRSAYAARESATCLRLKRPGRTDWNPDGAAPGFHAREASAPRSAGAPVQRKKRSEPDTPSRTKGRVRGRCTQTAAMDEKG
jgi:hypothetical protein